MNTPHGAGLLTRIRALVHESSPFGRIPGPARTVVAWLAFIALVVLFEVTAFNYQHWRTAGLEPVTIMEEGQLLDSAGQGWSAEETVLDGGEERCAIRFLTPIDVDTVKIGVSHPAHVLIGRTDNGVSNASYRVERDVFPDIEETTVVPLYSYGRVYMLALTLTDVLGEAQASVDAASLVSIQVNAPVPFSFSFLRVAVILLIALLIWGFSHKRMIFRSPVFCEDASGELKVQRASRVVLYALCAIIFCAISLGSLVHPRCLGWFGPGADESGEAASLLEYHHPGDDDNQYAELAESFLQGKLSLSMEPNPDLVRLSNPYDKSLRLALEGGDQADNNVLNDTAYYEGTYYVYFGVLPVLLFYLPWVVLTGQTFPTILGCAICLAFAIAGICSLLLQLARRFFPHVTLGVMMLCVMTVPLASMFAWCGVHPSVYTLPVICGLACLAWGASLYARLDRKPWAVIPGSILLAAIFACRPQMGIFCALLIPFGVSGMGKAASMLSDDAKRAHTVRVLYVAAALAPFIVVLGALGWYNWARFGSPFDFGASYNLTTNDMRQRPRSLDLVLESLYYYVVQLPNLEPTFPFLRDTQEVFVPSSFTVKEPSIGGFPYLAPIIWFMLGLISGSSAHTADGKGSVRWAWVVVVACASALIVIVFDGLAAGILVRYMMDFAMPLAVLGALGLMRCSGGASAASALALRPWVARCALACLLVSILVTVAIIFYSWDDVIGTYAREMQEIDAAAQALLF